MKALYIYLLTFLFSGLISQAAPVQESINRYQPTQTLKQLKAALSFWDQKATQNPQSYTYWIKQAQAHSALFDATSEISHLKHAERLYRTALASPLLDPSGVQRSLARNLISQHQFCEALTLAEKAYDEGSQKRASALLCCDIYAELGMDAETYAMLDELSEERDFEYLIRWAKWEDSQGDLPNAVALLEEAREMAEASGLKSYRTWIYSNLGDFYGHAGRIADAEASYIQALTLNPADAYSLKGLAWIAYAYEQNADKALKILDAISTYSHDPAIQKMRADIFLSQHKDAQSAAVKADLAQRVSHPDYGRMYAAFLVDYYLHQGDIDRAGQRAETEVTDRPTAASFDLLAQVYMAQGQTNKAQTISKAHIWNQTFEPGILKNQLHYFQHTSDPYLSWIQSEIADASFELGPTETAAMKPLFTR